jgi:hypothetical protein
MNSLKDIHLNQPVYIVGKGPSLHHLDRSMIGPGVIITINDAINKIEELQLPNVTYSMQKDGLRGQLIPHDCRQHTIMPKRSTLLVHKHESLLCYPDYTPRIVFDNLELGLRVHDFSALSAIRLAQLMGCNKFYFVSFDACTRKDGGQYQVEKRPIPIGSYFRQCEKMKPYLKDLDYEWITPEAKPVRGDIDVVYALGSGSHWRNNEICYSLRSIERHLKGWRRIFIVGQKPIQLGHVIHIPADDPLTNNADGNIALKVLLACADKRVSDTFLFINDDHVFLKDVNILDIPPYNKGDLRTKNLESEGLYIKRLRRTRDILIKHKLPTLHYDCHTPILIDKHKFPGIIKQFDFQKAEGYTMKSLYGNAMNFNSPYRADINIKSPLQYEDIVAMVADQSIMAYNDNGLNEDLKKFLNDQFPNKSNFEIMEKQRQIALTEAQQWLNDPKRTYKEGVRIYCQIGRDKKLMARFKQIPSEMMMQKLLTELAKLKDILMKEGVTPLAKTEVQKAIETPARPKATNVAGRLKVDNNPSLDINLLPEAEHSLYEDNQELTKTISALHAKLKTIEDPDERKRLANEITAAEDLRDENWKKLDAWWKNRTAAPQRKTITEPSGKYVKDVIEAIEDPAVKALSKELRIKANTNYVKRFRNSEKESQKKEVALRILELDQWGVKMKE